MARQRPSDGEPLYDSDSITVDAEWEWNRSIRRSHDPALMLLWYGRGALLRDGMLYGPAIDASRF